jgi:hypothetical protein
MNRACRLARKWSGGVLPNPIADSELPKWTLDETTVVRSPLARLVRVAAVDSDLLSAGLSLTPPSPPTCGCRCAFGDSADVFHLRPSASTERMANRWVLAIRDRPSSAASPGP